MLMGFWVLGSQIEGHRLLTQMRFWGLRNQIEGCRLLRLMGLGVLGSQVQGHRLLTQMRLFTLMGFWGPGKVAYADAVLGLGNQLKGAGCLR